MKTLQSIIVLILSCLSIQAVTNRPASDFSSVTSLTSTQKFMMLDTNRAASGGIVYAEVPMLLSTLATNPAPNNVRYWGAVGDGVTDDTVSIQTALNAQPVGKAPDQNTTSPAGIVTIPAGTYKISSPISIPCGVFLQGAGAGVTIITNTSSTLNTLQLKVTNNLVGNLQFGVADLSLVGPLNATSGYALDCSARDYGTFLQSWPIVKNVWTWGHSGGILLSNCVLGSFDNVYVRFPAGYGVKSGGTCNAITFKQVYSWFCGKNNFDFESANYCTFLNCAAEIGYGIGFKMGTLTNTAQRFCTTSFIGCCAETLHKDGFYFENAFGVSLNSCYSSAHPSNGFVFAGGQSFNIDSCRVTSIGEYGIYFTNGVSGAMPSDVNIRGCPSLAGTLGSINNTVLVNPTITASAGANSINIGQDSGTGTGTGNTGYGVRAGRYMFNGTNNTFSGYAALYAVTSGYNDSAYGYYSGFGNTSGFDNSNYGAHSGYASTTGSGNSRFGAYSGYELTTGDNNSIYGRNSGRGIVTGSGNTILGANVGSLDSALANNIIIANGTGAIKARNDGTDWTFTGNITATNVTTITSGSGAPSSTPVKVGNVYIDTTNHKVYFSTGTASSADWTITN